MTEISSTILPSYDHEEYLIILLHIAIYKLGGTLHIKGDELDKIEDKCVVREEDPKNGTFKFTLMSVKQAEEIARQSSLQERLDVS